MKIKDYLILIIFSLFFSSCNSQLDVSQGKVPPSVDNPGQSQPTEQDEPDAPTTPDQPGNPNQEPTSFRFAVISDMNKSYGSTTYLSELSDSINFIINQKDIELVLSTGDMVAGQKKGLNYAAMWQAFHQNVTAPLNNNDIAFAPSPGNHDASISSSFATEREEYKNTFTSRSKPVLLNKATMLTGSNFPLYYAFLYKQVLFVSMDATAIGPIKNEQYQWLTQTLENNSQVKAKVIFGHVPLLPFALNRTTDYLGYGNSAHAKAFEKLLEDHKVDLFLSGHHHVYYPGHRNGKVQYISVPLLGTGTRALLTDSNFTSERGFLVFDFDEKNGLTMKAIRSSNMSEIFSQNLPEYIRVPEKSSSNCTGCASFPSTLFIPNTDRYLFNRLDN